MQRLGILGGGQLGRMLIQSAINYNIYTKVLDPDVAAPCRSLCNEFVQGSFVDETTVWEFGQKLDVLTIEIEHVNLPALVRLQAAGVTVFPQPQVIEIIQDKGRQKEFFREHAIPTADFWLCADQTAVTQYAGPFPIVQKLRRLGYDGRGVKMLRSAEALKEAFTEPSLLEEYVEFECELAVIVARTSSGAVTTFPSVEMKFHPEANLVEWVLAPARVSFAVDKKAREIAIAVVEALQIVGVLAVEMFLTPSGDVLVNEIAPRPHNSGHHTIEGNLTSQYDQHLRAIFNWPLGDTATRSPAVMVNLLGEPGYTGEVVLQGLDRVLQEPATYVHLYGKTQTKPYRKMGHLTVLDANPEKALQRALNLQKTLKIISQ
ncbi:MAG: hypothetical protein ACD_43C00234G0002 [uncultured bacterium]|nr:MAG: hypothetical protein ACD_43C00234G0002 [uncultured bacterium]